MPRKNFVRLGLLSVALVAAAVFPVDHQVDAQTFSTPLNNASSVLASAHVAGSGTVSLTPGTGQYFGAPTPSAPIRLTIASRATLVNGQIAPVSTRTIYLVTGRSGDVLTGLTATEGTADRDYSKGDLVAVTITAGTIAEVQSAVSSVSTELTGKANADEVVNLTDDQSIEGRKDYVEPIGTPRVDHGTQGGTIAEPTPRTLLSFANRDPTNGRWECFVGGGPFDGVYDPVLYFGCNPNRDPALPGVNSSHTLTYNLEYDYFEESTGKRTVEGYVEFLSPFNDGLNRIQRRPWMFTMDQATGSTRNVIETGPAQSGWGYWEVVGGADKGGSFSLLRATAGTTVDNSTVAFNSPVTVGTLNAANPIIVTRAADPDTSTVGVQVKAGSDPSLGPLLVSLGAHTSATGGNRYAFLSAGDNNAMRVLALGTNGAGQFSDVAIGKTSASARLDVAGNIKASGSLSVGGGATLAKILSATAPLDFPSTSAQTSSDLTVSVTGAAPGDSVSVGLPTIPPSGTCFTGWVSAADVVTVRLNNYSSGAVDPGAGVYRVTVHQF